MREREGGREGGVYFEVISWSTEEEFLICGGFFGGHFVFVFSEGEGGGSEKTRGGEGDAEGETKGQRRRQRCCQRMS